VERISYYRKTKIIPVNEKSAFMIKFVATEKKKKYFPSNIRRNEPNHNQTICRGDS
jgi:hypothetical protein